MFDGGDFGNLRIVFVQPGMLKRIQNALQEIIQIPPAIIRRIEFRMKFRLPGENAGQLIADFGDYLFPILPPLATD